MIPLIRISGLLLLALLLPGSTTAQSVVVDQGTFSISLGGRRAGSETFTIRRAGLGSDATIIAHAVIQIDLEDGERELRPMLQTLPTEGAAVGYQLKISGTETTQLNMSLAGRRYVSVLRSERGEEEREFLARDQTRIVDAWVAHHYYFLRNLSQGERTWVIEPRTRKQFELTATASVDDPITVAGRRVPARRVTLEAGDDVRQVWFDDQGRVLRLEIPSLGYVAQREDLAG